MATHFHDLMTCLICSTEVIPCLHLRPLWSKTTFIISFIALEFFKPDSMKLQGGFARCYELTDMDTKQLFAGKIVAKTLLQKQHQKDKV